MLIFFFFLQVKIFSFSHFTSLSPSQTQNSSLILSYSLAYNHQSCTYQLPISIQNSTSSLQYFPMDLNTTTAFFSFEEKNLTKNFTILNITNLTVFFSDTLSLQNQTILLEIDSSRLFPEEFTSNNYHGIFGLGLSPEESSETFSALTIRKILSQFIEKSLINNTIFSLYLGSSPEKSNETQISFGGYNNSLVTNDLMFYTKTLTAESWSFTLLALEMVYYDENLLKGLFYSNITSIIDIASPNVLFPLEILNALIEICSLVYKTCTLISETNSLYCVDQYSFLEKRYPYIVFLFNSQLYLQINPTHLFFNCGDTSTGLSFCSLKIGLSSKNDTIFLGQAFLKNTYTIFDLENNTIGVSFENFSIESIVEDSSMTYILYVLLTIWGLTMLGCAIYFKVYFLRLNVMTYKITKIFYEKIRNMIRGNHQDLDLDESEESDENEEINNNNLNNQNLNNVNNLPHI